MPSQRRAPGRRQGGSALQFATSSLKLLAAANLFAMMAVTVVDVFGRYLFNAPLPGAFEITEVMMAVLAFSVLPIITARDDHLTIGLLQGLFKGRAKYLKAAFVSLVGLVFIALATWRVWIEAGRMAGIQDRTAYLGISLWPLAYFMFVMLAATLACLAVLVLANLRASMASGR
jgi:TRAP-type C4-dicarboxylate transport system permease small subunit